MAVVEPTAPEPTGPEPTARQSHAFEPTVAVPTATEPTQQSLPPIDLTPEEAELTWEWDDMHTPHALAPLAEDYVGLVATGFGYGFYRLDMPMANPARVWNGYWYVAFRIDAPEQRHDELRAELDERAREHMWRAADYWRDIALPELRATRDWFQGLRVDLLPLDRLADVWEEAWARAQRAWCIHFYAIIGPYQVTDDLAAFYEKIFEGAPAGEALRLIQGRSVDLQEMARGLERVVNAAAADPAVVDYVTTAAPPTLDDLEGIASAEPFLAELRSFLAEHGHLGGTFDDLALPSWVEEPSLLLGDVAKRLVRRQPPVAEIHVRVAAEADEIAGRVRARLADRPDDLATFERLLALGREIGPLTEGHNYWIDRLVQSHLRRFAFATAGRLVQAGVLEATADVLYLHRSEVVDVLRAPVGRTALVAERRALHERQRAHRPPAIVGKPKEPKPDSVNRFDGARFATGDENLLRGTGASAGVARGIARVVMGPDDFARVAPGEIIVCPSSNPSWVPLFSVAGGLLTNTGGVLSHAAVVAREFGLPAVVGLKDVTTRVADGRTVELDGTTGYVRLL